MSEDSINETTFKLTIMSKLGQLRATLSQVDLEKMPSKFVPSLTGAMNQVEELLANAQTQVYGIPVTGDEETDGAVKTPAFKPPAWLNESELFQARKRGFRRGLPIGFICGVVAIIAAQLIGFYL